MKTKFLKAFCLWLALMCGTALLADAPPFRTDINPALLYYRSFLLTPDLAKPDSDYLFNNSWQGQKLPERFGKLMGDYDNQFKLVRQARYSTVACDWGIDLSAGPNTLVPHLARAKAVAIATRLRVPWELQNGNQDDAREDLLAAFALARNLSRDGTLISVLVQIASEAIECSTIAANFGRFTPETLEQLATGLDQGPARGLVASSAVAERALSSGRLLAKVADLREQNPGNDQKVMEGIRRQLGLDENPHNADESAPDTTKLWDTIVQASGGTSEGVLRLVREVEAVQAKLAAFLAVPYSDYVSQVQSVKTELENSTNPFVKLSAPALFKARDREFRILATLALVRAGIEYKLHGDAGLATVADPCGNGPFAFRRFVFQGIDRGFELTSAYNLGGNQAVLIFVEKEGPPFQVDGNYPGRPIENTAPQQ